MIWGCLCGSVLGTKSAENLVIQYIQEIPSMDYFFPDGSGIFQDSSGSSCERVEHEDTFSHIYWPPQSPYFNPKYFQWG